MSVDIVQRLRNWDKSSAGSHCLGEAANEIERLRKEVAGLREWHRRDSAELRRLCEARDEARNALAVRMRERATADEHLAQVIAARDEAKAERDALRERIEGSATGEVWQHACQGGQRTSTVILTREASDGLAPIGKRVALVVLDDKAQG